MKRLLTGLLVAQGLMFQGFAQTKTPASKTTKPGNTQTIVMKNLLDSFSYAAGLNIASNMKDQGIAEINEALMVRAIKDAFSNAPLALTQEQANNKLQEYLQINAKKKAAAEAAEAKVFLDANKKRPGVTALPNGLQYEVMKAGAAGGMKPTSVSDTAVVHYTGTLTNGTKFDSSVDRGEPASFPLNGVIRGWTEILQLMTKGDKWKVVIPGDLAYGSHPPPGSQIPPGATLIFEIELLDVKPSTVK